MKHKLDRMVGDSAYSIRDGAGGRRMGLASSCNGAPYLNSSFITLVVESHLIFWSREGH